MLSEHLETFLYRTTLYRRPQNIIFLAFELCVHIDMIYWRLSRACHGTVILTFTQEHK